MVGARLAALLEQKKMRAGTLATRTGIPKATIYSILRRNNKNVDYSVLSRIAQELDVPVQYFLEEQPIPDVSSLSSSPIREDAFLSLFSQLTVEQQKFIIEAMKGLLHIG